MMMKRCKNPWIALMILLSFAASTPILGGGIWLRSRSQSTDCFEFLHLPIILIAALIMAASAAGLAGAFYDINILIYIYVWCTFAILLLLIAFIFFAYGVTEGTGRPVLNRAYQEFYLQDFYGWLVRAVTAPTHWAQIGRCLRGSRVCENMVSSLNGFPETADMFYTRNLSPIQSGCCKPPTACRFAYVNETYWKTTTTSTNRGMLLGAATERDCGRWSNDQRQLCYGCDSCKAGVMGSVRESWRTASVINLVMFFFLAIAYTVACIAFRLKKDDEPRPGWETGKQVEKGESSSRYYYSDETKIDNK